ncbi:MAG: Asp-tRNA(Asn)/Glu-tRNA(Gln) amidotransferase subunit GatA [Nanoarchaeota archaeon]|nr:Asp-tRNA(Asn)/Glu-tRNA(Gln) amidotransferase subunit GatA [Nanoarchaeota archaeon]
MTTVERVRECLQKIKKENGKINALLEIRPESELLKEAEEIDKKIKRGEAGRLAGKVIVVKANINIHGMNVSCASKVLEDYRAPYDATVVKKIRQEDGLIIGIANMDEFAAGFSGETSAFGPVRNPVNNTLITGGSSSGSAAAVAAGFCDMALGSDTGGSIRNPASICGVVGLKPSYGSVSRYGLIDLSMSLDQIGSLASNVGDVALLLSVIHGRDDKDATSIDCGKLDLKKLNKASGIRVGVLNLEGLGVDEMVKELINKKVEEVSSKNGWKTKDVNIENIDLAVETYYPLVYVEFFSATRRFDGRRYGKKIEDVAGPEVLRRILGGGEITKAEHEGRYYNSAIRVKEFIRAEFSKNFKSVDCIVSPVLPRLPWKIGEKISVEDGYAMDVLTIPSNLAGNCSISVPVGKIDGIPVGIQITCDKFNEEKLLQIAKAFE